MTKVGVYSALRVFTLAFGDIPGAGEWPWSWLLPAGLATVSYTHLDVYKRQVLGDDMPSYSLSIWHGFNLPLMMSLGGMLCGIALYFSLRRLFDIHAIVRRSWGRHLFYVNVDALYNLCLLYTSRCV